jgi:hypothetical protein
LVGNFRKGARQEYGDDSTLIRQFNVLGMPRLYTKVPGSRS